MGSAGRGLARLGAARNGRHGFVRRSEDRVGAAGNVRPGRAL